MSILTIYMPLLDEGTDVWRPVQAESLLDGHYRIISINTDCEKWAFASGTVVQGHLHEFSDGKSGIVAAAILNSPVTTDTIRKSR